MEPPEGQAAHRVGVVAVRDPARALRRAVAAVAVLTGLAVGAAVTWSIRQAGAELLARDLATAAGIAQIVSSLPPEDRDAAVAQFGDHGTVALLEADGRLVPADLGTGQEGPLWRRWTGLVVRTSKVRSEFRTRDPSGTQWWHVTVPVADGGQVLLQRPDPTASAVQRVVLRGFAGAGAALATLGALAWLAVRKGFLDSVDRLISASGDLRWRGRLRPPEQRSLEGLARRGDQVGRLAGSLLAVDDDINRNFLQLSTLLETSRLVAASLDPHQVFDNILAQISRLFAVERCAVMNLDERANAFVIRASLGLSDSFVRDLRVSPSEPNSPAMRALRSGQPVQISDTASDLSYADLRHRSEREGFRSVLAIPLSTTMAPPSVLLLYNPKPHRYSYSELELASSFVRFASLAMENAALYARIDERLQEQTRRLEAIVESLDDGLILADPSGQVAYHNPAAAQLLGMDAEQLSGAHADQVLRRLGAGVSMGGAAAHPAPPVVVSSAAGGRRRDLRIHSFVVTDEHGAPLGQGQLWQDITQDRAVERMKSALLATVSHELRTPLANIKGYVSTLLADDVQWELGDQRDFLATISAEADRLAKLVEDVLDMSQIEAGIVTLAPESVRCGDLIGEVVAALPPHVQGRVQVEIPAGLPPVEADRARLQIAVRNLVDNALKFSPPDSLVDVTARCEDGALLVTVRDRGAGISHDLEDRVFDSFVRGDDGLARRAGGFGLGLAICRGFVEAHGGRVWFEAAHPGSRFCFAVPVRRLVDAVEAGRP